MWYIENAVFTVFTAATVSLPAVHAVVDEDEEGDALGDADGDTEGDADGEWLGDALGEALADPEADGLALAVVSVIVVTLPDVVTVAVTRAPVVPINRIPANTPDFACRKSSRSRSSTDGPPLPDCSNEAGPPAVRPVRRYAGP